jgi:muramoyltetrapeptide carboxypeptidase LdcA involved in peptidoglycan recycling
MNKKFTKPPFLKPGDEIHLVAPAGALSDFSVIDRAVVWIESQGWKAVVHEKVYRRFGSLAGRD